MSPDPVYNLYAYRNIPFDPIPREERRLHAHALAGTVGWLLIAPVPREIVPRFLWIAGFFLSYCVLGCALLFFRFDRKRDIYRVLLLFDLVFVYLLIVNTGGFASSFFMGFYLLTALHSFYYGYRSGLVVAVVCGDLPPCLPSRLCNRTDRLSAPCLLPFPHRTPDRPPLGNTSQGQGEDRIAQQEPERIS